jgi:uncharacterized HhH-GPD family protein
VTELHLAQDAEADRLLSESPLALLIGMVLDQQVPLEWAFAGPAELKRRLGGRLDASELAQMDPEKLAEKFTAKPALHRYPGSMAKRVHELCVVVVDAYGGDPTRIWSDVSSGSELLSRIKELPGFGDQKAKIFVALLGKQLGVRPDGWEQVSTPYSDPGSTRSVADIVDPESLATVRAFKQQAKLEAKAKAPSKR